ncbi:MAG: FlgO family outer membrane protein [Treponemataceae bacterium]
MKVVTKIVRIATAAILFAAAANVSAQETATFPKVVGTLASGLSSSEALSKPLRVAFLALASGNARVTGGKDFGLFFSESLAAAVKGTSARVRIFERQRLADILTEHELDASGALDGAGAVRIGELAPVDAIFTGSYARTGETVAVNARLVSVVTGEVLFAQSHSIALDDSIRDFFPNATAAAAARQEETPISDADKLKAALAEMKALLARLSTEGEVAAAAAKASIYPIFGLYAPVHQLTASTFIRYKKDSPSYRAYLIAGLSAAKLIATGEGMYALMYALDYFEADGDMDEKEFDAGLVATRGLRDVAYYNVVFERLLHPYGRDKGQEPVDRDRLAVRVARIMADIRAGRMGTPSGIDYTAGLLELLGAVQKDSAAFLSVYDPYIGSVPKDRLAAFASPLKRRFGEEKEGKLKTALLARIADNAVARGRDKNFATELYSFISSLDRKEGEQDYAAEFARRCGELLSAAIPLVPYNKEDRILLCLRYEIDAPGLVPGFDDIVRGLLLGDTVEARRASARMLDAMGARAAPAEATIRKVLKYIGDGSIGGVGSPNLQTQCLAVLANIGTRDPASLALIAAAMRHSYSDVREAAADAFLRIGKPSLPYVIEIVRGGEKVRKLEALKLLARMGKEAAGAAGELAALLKTEKDPFVKDAIEDAATRIR